MREDRSSGSVPPGSDLDFFCSHAGGGPAGGANAVPAGIWRRHVSLSVCLCMASTCPSLSVYPSVCTWHDLSLSVNLSIPCTGSNVVENFCHNIKQAHAKARGAGKLHAVLFGDFV